MLLILYTIPWYTARIETVANGETGRLCAVDSGFGTADLMLVSPTASVLSIYSAAQCWAWSFAQGCFFMFLLFFEDPDLQPDLNSGILNPKTATLPEPLCFNQPAAPERNP